MEAGVLQKAQMKKKKNKRILCYFGLVILFILLLTPPLLRLFVSEDSGKETKKVEYIALNCTKGDESISATFADGVPQNIMYKVNGNLVDNSLNENLPDVDSSTSTIQSVEGASSQEVTTNPQTSNESSIIDSASIKEIFSSFKRFEYDSVENVSTIRLTNSEIKSNAVYSAELETINKQENLYTSRGFSCAQNKF